MAQLRLEREEVEEGALPAVCMRCGAAATTTTGKNFSWHPQWVIVLLVLGLLPYVIGALVTTKRMYVYAPMCEAHKRHWSFRTAVVLLSLLGLVLLVVGILATAGNNAGPGRNDLGGLLCVGGVVGLVGWVILAVIMQATAIRPTEITDDEITLTGIAPGFVDAVKDERDRSMGRFHDSEKLQRWQDESERFFTPDARRQQDLPPDAYREDER